MIYELGEKKENLVPLLKDSLKLDRRRTSRTWMHESWSAMVSSLSYLMVGTGLWDALHISGRIDMVTGYQV